METKIITDNGVELYSYPNTNLHSFCLSLYVKYGCLYEREDESGLAHLIEHTVFRNIDHLVDGELSHILDKHGLTFNATTYKEFIHFYINGSPTHFNLAADIFSKVLSPIAMTVKELEIEKKRVKAEIREDNYRTTLDCFSNEIIWKGTPLTRSICGTCKSVDSISKSRLAEYKKCIFSLKNIFFYVTGNINKDNINYLASKIEQYSLSEGKTNDNCVKVPDGFYNRNGSVYLKNCNYSVVRFSFDIETAKYSDAEMELFFDVMFSGDSCVIFQNLSEKSGLIYGYDARFSKYNNIGNIYFSYEVHSTKLYESIEIVVESLNKLKQEVGGRINYIKAPYIDNAMIMYDNPEEFNWSRAYEVHILNCEYTDIDDRIKAFASVTAEDLTQIAVDVLKKDNLVVTLKGNKKKIDLNKIRSIVSKI